MDGSSCLPSCTFHGDAIVSSVTWAKNSADLEKILSSVCASSKPWRMKDSAGKNILHLAASQGKVELIEWYLRHVGFEGASMEKKRALLNDIDEENGWTPLHRAFYQGEISAAWTLLKKGADLNFKDHDGYSPLQLLIFDAGRISNEINNFPKCSCCIVAFFAWGTNSNFALGFGDDQARSTPEKVRGNFSGKNAVITRNPRGDLELNCNNCETISLSDGGSESLRQPVIAKGEIHLHQGRCSHYFGAEKSGSIAYLRNPVKSLLPYSHPMENELYAPKLSLMDIVLRKFHSLILSSDGSVYSCGHGQGGRLGLNTEKTILQPTRITFPGQVQPEVIAISAGLNHSVFLTKEEFVFTCGSNEFGQLGLESSPAKVLVPTRLSMFGPMIQQKNAGNRISFHIREGQFGVAADRYHTLFWTGRALYACGYNAGQLGPLRTEYNKKPGSGPACWMTPHEINSISSFCSPPRFVKCSDAAVLVCSNSLEMIVLHDYESRRLPRLPLLVRVRPNEEYQLTELCVFGGNLHSPGAEGLVKRELVIVALAFGMPLLFVDQKPGFWRPISITGIPRDISEVHHISLSYDTLLISTSYGECYSMSLSKHQTHATLPPMYRARRISKLWRALKVFSEPGSRNFAAIQMVGRSKTGDLDRNLYSHEASSAVADFREGEIEPVEDGISPGMMIELTGNDSFQELVTGDAAPLRFSHFDNPAVYRDAIASRKRLQKEKLRIRIGRVVPGAKGMWDYKPDVEFVCDDDGETVNAHRAVLIQKTLYFRLLLEGKRWKDLTERSLPVLPCDFRTGLRLVEYIYNGGLEERSLTLEECMQLILVADFLVFEKLREYAGSLFEPFLNHDQLYPFYRLAQSYSSDALNHLCIFMMTTMIPELLENHHFETLDRFTAEQLNWKYREQPHLRKLIAGRVITPHEIPGLSREKIGQVSPRKYGIDSDFLAEPVSDQAIKSALKKSKNQAKIEPKSPKDIVEKSAKTSLVSGAGDDVDSKQFSGKTGERIAAPESPKTPPKPKALSIAVPNGSGDSAPVKSPEVKSLAEIMAEENKMQRGAKLPKIHLTKKKFVGKSLEEFEALPVSEPPKPIISEPARPKGNPWQTSLPSTSKSFNDIMSDQAVSLPVQMKSSSPVGKSSPPKTTPKSQPISLNWKNRKSEPNSVEEIPPRSPISHFLQIQKEEAAQLVQLEKSRRKPLGLIQIEERAIEELLDFYGAVDNPEELITVQRVLPKQANVSWSARE